MATKKLFTHFCPLFANATTVIVLLFVFYPIGYQEILAFISVYLSLGISYLSREHFYEDLKLEATMLQQKIQDLKKSYETERQLYHDAENYKVKKLEQQNDSLLHDLSSAEEDKKYLCENIEKLKEQLLEAQKAAYEPLRDFRIIQGKYHQLRAQFDEKCDLIDQTRKQLFQAEEKILQLQNDLDEESRSRIPEMNNMEKYILRVEKDYQTRCANYDQEIQALSSLIDLLTEQK